MQTWENSIFCHCCRNDAHHISLSYNKDDYDVLCHLIFMASHLPGFIPLSSPRLPCSPLIEPKLIVPYCTGKVGLQNKHWLQFHTWAPFVSCFLVIILSCKILFQKELSLLHHQTLPFWLDSLIQFYTFFT